MTRLDVRKGESEILQLKDYIDEVLKEEKIDQIEETGTRVDEKGSNNLVNNKRNILGKLVDIEYI